jgi:tRNA (adenine-N(1)-)-methyltransferase non-catalytic subunit
LIGLPYGTVLELGKNGLVPLADGEDLLPEHPTIVVRSGEVSGSPEDTDGDSTMPAIKPYSVEQSNDNRHLLDDNKSQSMKQAELVKLKRQIDGADIIQALIENSATFDSKTEFSKAKYITRKQKKYQQRCRLVRCTASTVCEALFNKDPRKLMNMREDTLGQILSHSNITAGCQVLLMETGMGVVTGAVAQRIGGYGKILSIYSGQQPTFTDMLAKFNLSFAENHSIKYIHSGDVFADDALSVDVSTLPDPERLDREKLQWPCPLQDHTRAYLETITDERELDEFMSKRCSRFARKLSRHTPTEGQEMLLSRPCDSIIIVSRHDPTSTLLKMLPFLAPSCPFVVYCEFLEPLTECFHEIQRQGLAINLKLSDTWMREYQVLPGRTHPNMNMSQNGGFLLVGIKLCPVTGHNEIDEDLLKELRAKLGGKRGKKPKRKQDEEDSAPKNGIGKEAKLVDSDPTRDSKRARVEDNH